MTVPVTLSSLLLPPVSEKEVLRYAGEASPCKDSLALLASCIEECGEIFATTVCYGIFPLEKLGDSLRIANLTLTSKALQKNLARCDEVILMAATAGMGIDRMIARYAKLSPSRSFMMHALGAERVEALCDAFCKNLEKEKGYHLCPRFSAGYGDLPLALQKDIITLLDANKHLGIGLTESLLLSPSKSVTAFVGIQNENR